MIYSMGIISTIYRRFILSFLSFKYDFCPDLNNILIYCILLKSKWLINRFASLRMEATLVATNQYRKLGLFVMAEQKVIYPVLQLKYKSVV